MEEAGGGERVTELWYQLPAEMDASAFFPTLSETGVRGEQTDFPSMEEGTIQSEADLQKGTPGGRTLPLQLDFQDSRLSPCLPLLTSGSVPGHKFFEDTLFQQTESEFAPLRASLDMSDFPDSGSPSLQITDAVKLASREVLMVQEEDAVFSSRHCEEKSPDRGDDLSGDEYLSQHPLNVSHKEDDAITESLHSDPGALKEMDRPSVEDLMAEDGSFLGSNVPAPVLLELLEKEVGMSAGSGSSSRCSSETAGETEHINSPSQGPEKDEVSIPESQGQTKTPTGQLNLGQETFRDSSEIHFDDAEMEKINLNVSGQLDRSGITVRQPKRQSSPGLWEPKKDEVSIPESQGQTKTTTGQLNLAEETFRDSSEIHFDDAEMEKINLNVPGRLDRSSITVRQPNWQSSPGIPEPKKEEVNIPEPQGPNKTGQLNLAEETLRDSSEMHFDDPKMEKVNLSVPVPLDLSGITVWQSNRHSSPWLQNELQKQLCAEIQQEGKKRMSDVHKSGHDSGSSSQNAPGLPDIITKASYRGEDTMEEQPGGELTMSSHFSIERGHKETDVSQAINTPIDEASFWRLAYPISQSTPGTFSVNRKPLAGRIQEIKAKLTGSDMSLNEEPISSSSNPNEPASGVPQSIQSSQGYPESSDSQRSPSPQRRKIQSLPSLNYIEKVGTWNTNQSFDTLVLRGLTGVSPKKLAYDAVADSLNRMFSKRTDASKKGLDPPFKTTSSMIDLNVEVKESSSASQLTRSQSYNSVMAISKERKEANVGPVAEGDMAAKSAKVQPNEAVGSDSFLSRDISDETERLNMRSTTEKDDTAHVPSDGLEKSSHQPETRPDESNRSLSKNLITMERFSDVSLDQEFSGSFHTSDQDRGVLQDSVGSSGPEMSHHHHGEPLMQTWSGEGATPETDEFNIEERIPTYLRNLGINQSPTTILMPFTPRGPIREPEFSPSELRTIKSSNATPNRSMRLSEGESQANISQSSLYSTPSTTSVSIPMGSEVELGSPLPTEPSPQISSRSTNDRPISQDNTATQGIRGDQEVYLVQTMDGERKQESPDAQELNDLGSALPVSHDIHNLAEDSAHVRQLIEQFESAGSDARQDNLEQLNLGPLSSSWKKPHPMDSTNDSFVGSKTLKEIRKLLSEADAVNLDRTTSDFNPQSPLRATSITSPAASQSFQDSLKSGASNSRSASPLDLQLNNMSWDTSFNSSVASDNLLNNGSSAKPDLHWKEQVDRFSPAKESFYLKDTSKELSGPFSLHKHGRSEPEGSSEAAAVRMAPVSAHLQEGSMDDLSGEGLHQGRLLSNVTRAIGGLKQVLDLTGSGNLRSTGEESDASSGDSLAARVKSLLKSNNLSYTSQVRQTAEDENHRGRGSMKLKLAGQPIAADDDLNEEDRRRIEEIKRELLDGAKGAEKSHQYSTFEPGPARGSEHFRLQLTPSPDLDQYHVTGVQDSIENRIVPLAASSYGASGVQSHSMTVGNIKAVATVTLQSDQPTLTSSHPQQGLMTDLHTPGSDKSAAYLDRKTTYANKYGEEVAKPIASITFSSRKRSSPLLTSASPETAELSSATGQYNYDTPLADPYNRDKSLTDPYYTDKSLTDPYNRDKPLADPYNREKSLADPYYTDKSLTDPYNRDKPLADPYYTDKSLTDPYNRDKPLADPYNRDKSLTDPYYTDKSLTDPYNRDKPLADPYNRDKSLTDPYYTDKSLTDPYNRDKSLADPYYRDMPRHEPYYKDKPLAGPYYKDKSHDDLYDKGKPCDDPYHKDRADPYYKDRSHDDQFNKGKPLADPYNRNKPLTDPYYKDMPRSDTYDRDKSHADPYDKDKPRVDPYDKEKPRVDPYDKDKPRVDSYYKDMPHADPYGKGQPSDNPYYKDKPLADPYYKDKSSVDPYYKEKPRDDQYDKDKSGDDPYYKFKSHDDPYHKDKPRDDPYYKDKPLTDLYYKEKPSTDLHYKDNQPSETDRSNFIHHPSTMDTMIPQNASTSDITFKGELKQNEIVVSEFQGQSEVIKSHIQPDQPSMVGRSSPMNEDGIAPSVSRPNETKSLQKDFTGPSHSALISRSPLMSELPPQISNVSAKEWKFYPEQINTERVERDGAYGFPSQEPTTATSPTRKALSCIRVTISPKDQNVSPVMVASGTSNDGQTFRSPSGLMKNEQVLTSHSLSSVPPCIPYFLHAPQGEVRTNREDNVQMEDKENKATTKDQRRLPLFDATTQITTESPEKTTFSAEIYIDGSLKEASSSIVQTQKTPERKPTMPIASLSRATDQPTLLPYRPPGSPELFYIPVMNDGSRMSSISTIESSHPGSNDAISPKFPSEILGSAAEKVSDASIRRHRDGIYSKDQSPKVAWEETAGEKRKMPGTELLHDDRKVSYGSLQHRVSSPDVSAKNFQRERRDLRAAHDEEFYPLKPEVDYAQEQQTSVGLPKKMDYHDHLDSKISDSPRKRDQQEQTNVSLLKKMDYHDHLDSKISDSPRKRDQQEQTNVALLKKMDYHDHLDSKISDSPRRRDLQEQTRVGLPKKIDYHDHHGAKITDSPRRRDQQEQTGVGFPKTIDYHDHHGPKFTDSSRRRDQQEQTGVGLPKKMDYHGHHGAKITDSPRSRDQQEQTSGTPPNSTLGSWNKLGMKEKHVTYEDCGFPGGQRSSSTKSFQRTESMLSQSALSNQSLDDLWARYSQRQKSHLSDSSSKLEISLVERLDRLARLLQNPMPYSLVASKDTNGDQILKVTRKDNEKRREAKKEEREKWYLKKFGVDPRPVNGASENQDDSDSRLWESPSSEKVPSGESLYSDFSSEVRSSATEESAGGSETTTQTDSTSTIATNSTISTIDTVRLINAFGPERVRPSSKLSRLYNTIDLQKKRSTGTSKKASRSSPSRGHSTMEIKDLHKSVHKVPDTESVSSGSSWESTPVMRSKSGNKVLNKGIQAGDLEIVTGATKRHTRDVGTTFPSPGGEMLKPLAEREMPAYGDCGVRRPKTKQYIPTGLSWFVPADMKCDSPKENKLSGPGPAWYESITNAKPWREPLRERNQQAPPTRRGEITGSERRKDDTTVQPFVRVTLQESLKAHRPDFIFHSGERVKRLQLLTKERKLQSVFQSEREALFNQPGRRGGPAYRAPYKEFRTSQKMKNVSKKEMVQRSKRIYEQLPEIKRRKEEEKRRSEYETYRLKAQLFRKKVTNHILGRKTPWN
ncbi:centrosome-associated protein ALMS1 [Mantella aurantiaca]